MLSKPNYNRFTISITIYLYNSLLKYSKNFNYILFYLYCYQLKILYFYQFVIFCFFLLYHNQKHENFKFSFI